MEIYTSLQRKVISFIRKRDPELRRGVDVKIKMPKNVRAVVPPGALDYLKNRKFSHIYCKKLLRGLKYLQL